MTTIQFAQRLTRNLQHTDLATLPVAASLDVLGAFNYGLQELWRYLPWQLRTKTLSYVLKAPETLSVTMNARYDNTTSGTPFSTDLIGCTVRVNDDVRDNEVTGASTLRDAFIGQNLTGNALLFHDALQIFDAVERIVGDMRIYRSDGTWYPLHRAEGYRRGGTRFAWYEGYPIPYPTGFNGLKPAQRPLIYLLESEAIDTLTASEFFLKFYPMPDQDYTVRFEAEVGPRVITFANLTDHTVAVDVPVRGSLAESCLLPLCEEALLRSPFLANSKGLPSLIQAAADRARQTLRNRAGDAALPNNEIGTPPGY